jgi:translation initiation factor IF-2
MTEQEIITLINEFSTEKIQTIEAIDTAQEGKVVVIGVANKIKKLEFTLTESGDFSYKYLGLKLRRD